MKVKYLINGRVVSEGELEALPSRLDELLASRQPPWGKTDATFLHASENGRQFEATPEVGDLYRRRAEAAGVDITGAVYKGALADYPGDPEAWVRGRGDVARLCERRGWSCAGAVTVKAREPCEPPAEVAVAEDILAGRALARLGLMDEGQRARADRRELAEAIREEIKPYWAK